MPHVCCLRLWSGGSCHVADVDVRGVRCGHTCWQDDIYRPNYYQSLMEFREQTLQRLQKFVAQKFFSVRDYVNGEGE